MHLIPRCLLTALGLLAASAHIFASDSEPMFEEVAEERGLIFRHFAGRTGDWAFPEINGAGVALFDFDGDGDLDVYLVQGAVQVAGTSIDQLLEPLPDGWPEPPSDRLFRNELLPSGKLTFTDVTARAGLKATGYGMAVGIADFDRDGHDDLYLANYGENQLWRNRGDGSFEDVTKTWAAFESRWSSAVSPLDYDGDGWTDLFVGNYLRFDPGKNRPCFRTSGARDYCHPSTYPPEADLLLRNVEGRRFEDVSDRALPDRGSWPTLGSIVGDWNGDGRSDLYVANDDEPNQLWWNQGDGTFLEDGLLGGCSVNGRGEAEASMGVVSGDVDGDGDDDLFLTHLGLQTNTLYLNDGTGLFIDATTPSGLGSPSWAATGFGTVLTDLDNDSDLDLVAANGAVEVLEELDRAGDPLPFHQPNQVFLNTGKGTFVDATREMGPAFALSETSRGLAVGDLDNDGDPDLVLTNNSGPARVMINRVGQRNAWIGLRLLRVAGEGSDPVTALGARVLVRRPEQLPLQRSVRTDGSYASSHDPRALIGLGAEAPKSLDVEVYWQDGGKELFESVTTRRYTDLVQGTGRSLADATTPSPGDKP